MAETATPPVAETVAPVATPPNRPPAVESDDPAALKVKLALALQDRTEQGEKNQRMHEQLTQLQKQLTDLQTNVQTGKHKQLEEKGELQPIVDDLRSELATKVKEIEALNEQLNRVQQAAAEERIAASTIRRISDAGAFSPEQLYVLLQPRLKLNEQKLPVVLNGGVEVPFDDYLASLKQPGSGFEHHFQIQRSPASFTAEPSFGGAPAPVTDNPFMPATWNRTQQAILELQNPQLYARLQAEAAAASAT